MNETDTLLDLQLENEHRKADTGAAIQQCLSQWNIMPGVKKELQG